MKGEEKWKRKDKIETYVPHRFHQGSLERKDHQMKWFALLLRCNALTSSRYGYSVTRRRWENIIIIIMYFCSHVCLCIECMSRCLYSDYEFLYIEKDDLLNIPYTNTYWSFPFFLFDFVCVFMLSLLLLLSCACTAAQVPQYV